MVRGGSLEPLEVVHLERLDVFLADRAHVTRQAVSREVVSEPLESTEIGNDGVGAPVLRA